MVRRVMQLRSDHAGRVITLRIAEAMGIEWNCSRPSEIAEEIARLSRETRRIVQVEAAE